MASEQLISQLQGATGGGVLTGLLVFMLLGQDANLPAEYTDRLQSIRQENMQTGVQIRSELQAVRDSVNNVHNTLTALAARMNTFEQEQLARGAEFRTLQLEWAAAGDRIANLVDAYREVNGQLMRHVTTAHPPPARGPK